MKIWKEVSWESAAGSFTNEIWLEQYLSVMEKFGADSDDVSVWELVGLLLVKFSSRF